MQIAWPSMNKICLASKKISLIKLQTFASCAFEVFLNKTILTKSSSLPDREVWYNGSES